ncbi:MAG: hypothetical protein AABW92_03415 [Nanoarchaeota archaeon]
MNITKATEEYISSHPSIRDCVSKGLINYSALAREICDELKIDSFDAVLIAIRRYFLKINSNENQEKEILKLLKNVKVRVRNKILVTIMDKPRDMEKIYMFQKKIKKDKGDFNLIEGENSITLVTNSKYSKEIKEEFKHWIIKNSENLVQIAIIFDPQIETTPGIVNYVYGLLAENGINILEEMSCWTDLMIIIDEKDLAKTMKVLSF